MSRIETKSVPFEIKMSEGDGSSISGIAAAFSNIDSGRDIIATYAYDDYISSFASEGKIRDEHEVTTGRVTEASKVPPTGLMIKGMISDTTHGKNQKILLKDRVITRLSIGHYVLGREYLESPEEIKSFWDSVGYTPSETDLVRSGQGPVRLIVRAKPVEVSTTWNPMNDKCSITSVKANAAPHGSGLTFADHSENTLAVLEEFEGRARRLFERRKAESGRTLSRKHVAAFHALKDRLSTLLDAMETPAPESKGDSAAVEVPTEATTDVVEVTVEVVEETKGEAAPEAEAPEPDPAPEAITPDLSTKADEPVTETEAAPEPPAESDATPTPAIVDATGLYAEVMATLIRLDGISV